MFNNVVGLMAVAPYIQDVLLPGVPGPIATLPAADMSAMYGTRFT